MAALDGLQRPAARRAGAAARRAGRAARRGRARLAARRRRDGRRDRRVGGVLIAAVGLPATYGVDLATFAVSLVLPRAMRAVPPPPDAEPPSLRAIVEGFATR